MRPLSGAHIFICMLFCIEIEAADNPPPNRGLRRLKTDKYGRVDAPGTSRVMRPPAPRDNPTSRNTYALDLQRFQPGAQQFPQNPHSRELQEVLNKFKLDNDPPLKYVNLLIEENRHRAHSGGTWSTRMIHDHQIQHEGQVYTGNSQSPNHVDTTLRLGPVDRKGKSRMSKSAFGQDHFYFSPQPADLSEGHGSNEYVATNSPQQSWDNHGGPSSYGGPVPYGVPGSYGHVIPPYPQNPEYHSESPDSFGHATSAFTPNPWGFNQGGPGSGFGK